MQSILLWTMAEDGTEVGIAWKDSTRAELHLWFRRPQTHSEIDGAATDLSLPPIYVGRRAQGMWFTQLKLTPALADTTILALEGLLAGVPRDTPEEPRNVGGEIDEDGLIRIAAYRPANGDDDKFDEGKQCGFAEERDGRIVTGINWSRKAAHALTLVLKQLRRNSPS